MTWDTCKDIATCFTSKQVVLGFSSLALRLTEALLRVVHVTLSRRLRREEAEDGWINATGCVGPFYPKIVVSSVLGSRGTVVF
jgi:hypothetical protein